MIYFSSRRGWFEVDITRNSFETKSKRKKSMQKRNFFFFDKCKKGILHVTFHNLINRLTEKEVLEK